MKLENSTVQTKHISSNYNSFRIEIIAYIKSISKKLRLQARTYYLACFIVDRIYLSNKSTEFKPAITAISSILLAGMDMIF